MDLYMYNVHFNVTDLDFFISRKVFIQIFNVKCKNITMY